MHANKTGSLRTAAASWPHVLVEFEDDASAAFLDSFASPAVKQCRLGRSSVGAWRTMSRKTGPCPPETEDWTVEARSRVQTDDGDIWG